MEHLKSLADENSVAIVVNNPSNPCGSVYSEVHLKEILNGIIYMNAVPYHQCIVAEELHVPIIADEIYADMAFKPHKFVPLASLTKTVPILTVGGLAKQYLVPGWRVGWVLINDRNNLFSEVQ